MVFPPVKQPFHPLFGTLRHALETSMLKPALGSIFRERKFRQAVPGDVLVQVQ